ncbi:hypothetical protein E2562_023976 [Oryza meyeriana var. granulata]|uniref:Uncharacterized protein n=1 Tax=Oryza meyeriana var. granulata TaxID=110450 RepID=A0A6G1BZN9_9ORYZ|nr:hypothetical protein E2562_023976 [Oryza meyeriana var. granulata]
MCGVDDHDIRYRSGEDGGEKGPVGPTGQAHGRCGGRDRAPQPWRRPTGAVADCGGLRRLDAEAETTTGRTLAALQRRNGRGDA